MNIDIVIYTLTKTEMLAREKNLLNIISFLALLWVWVSYEMALLQYTIDYMVVYFFKFLEPTASV